MTLKDYIENNIGISIGGTYLHPYATIYPKKARLCEKIKNICGREKSFPCILYNYKNQTCKGDFKCENGKPLEKCYKFITKTTDPSQHNYLGDLLSVKILELRSKKY